MNKFEARKYTAVQFDECVSKTQSCPTLLDLPLNYVLGLLHKTIMRALTMGEIS